MKQNTAEIDPFELIALQEQYLSRKKCEQERSSIIKNIIQRTGSKVLQLEREDLQPIHTGDFRVEKLLGSIIPTSFIAHAEIYHIDLKILFPKSIAFESTLIVRCSHDDVISILEMDVTLNEVHITVSENIRTFFEVLVTEGLLQHGEIDIVESKPISDSAWNKIQQIITLEGDKLSCH